MHQTGRDGVVSDEENYRGRMDRYDAFIAKEPIINHDAGILLLDPQFKLPHSSPYYLTSSHSWRDQHYSTPKARTSHGSNRKTYLDYLKNVFTNNTSLLVATQNEPFLILEYIYRLAASHWLVMNEYINRELATIEYILEQEDPGFQDLETYIKDLYVHRRRCTKYHDLIKQAKEQCVKRGQNSWPKDTPSPLAADHSKSLEDDFSFCLFKIRETANRIEKSINLLTALVTIGEGKQGLDENRGLAWLSLLATIFLPFSTVATILAMQGSYAPGGGQFWIFWVVAIPLTASVVAVFLYAKELRRHLKKIMARIS